jgi:LysR family transcriptional regulator, benzoate and cis,cis-muconate-responsive activator of ben and cat genes
MLITMDYHRPWMELRHLRYFVAVAEELSFRKAAQRLDISRPALSKQVKDLEDEISVKLLDRDTVSVGLTQAGELFLHDAKKLLVQAERAIERAKHAQSGNRSKLRIGSVGIISPDFLPEMLKLFGEMYPTVEVSFFEMTPTDQLDALAKGRIDIGFVQGEQDVHLTSLRSLCVVHSYFGVAMASGHTLASQERVTLQETRGETLLCLGSDELAGHRDTICKIYPEGELRPSKIQQVEKFDVMLQLIADRGGVSLLPHALDLTDQGVAIIPIMGTKEDLDFHLRAVWQRHLPSPHVKRFVDLLEKRVNGNAPDRASSSINHADPVHDEFRPDPRPPQAI